MLHTTQLSTDQSGLMQNDVGDATAAADPIATLPQDAETKKRAAAAKRQRACRANAKANKGVEAISKQRKAEPGRQPAVRSKKQKLEPARRERLPSAPPSDLETANAALFLFLWCSFRLDLCSCTPFASCLRYSGRGEQDCTCLERYLHDAKQANIKAGAAREVMAGRWANAVARAKGNPILAEAIRADIVAQAAKEITAAGAGGEPQSDALAQLPSAAAVLFGAAKPAVGLTADNVKPGASYVLGRDWPKHVKVVGISSGREVRSHGATASAQMAVAGDMACTWSPRHD